jgi:hypothetical protein
MPVSSTYSEKEGSYVRCFEVNMIRVWRWDPIFAKLKPGRKSVKGEAKDDKRPISNVQQVISSQHL